MVELLTTLKINSIHNSFVNINSKKTEIANIKAYNRVVAYKLSSLLFFVIFAPKLFYN